MTDDKTQPITTAKLAPVPVQVIQSANGYMAIYEKNLIAFGSGQLPHEVDS
jgi:hypothetical protein